jgi:CubicO group peptidase (beta-lactamase class C family)
MALPANAAAESDESKNEALIAQVRELTEQTLGNFVRGGRSSFGEAVLVMNGRREFERVYGVENPWSRTPISLTSSLVDLNSIKKLFVSVALAQLIDRHVIHSVEDPVNLYLKHFKLPLAFGKEVTIRQIATHNAGFDEAWFGAGPLDGDPARFFHDRFPGYFVNTGPFSAYSVYGPLLLAYMVNEVTGIPFARYITDDILRPLGMNDTFFGEPVSGRDHRVVPFYPATPDIIAVGPPLKPLDATLPNGQIVSTGQDMATFMRALLGAADQSVITDSMRQVMFSIYQANGEWGSAHALLFEALRTGPTTIFVHAGTGPGLTCQLALEFIRKAGLFYCYGDLQGRHGAVPPPPEYEKTKFAMLEPLSGCSRGRIEKKCPHYGASSGWNTGWDSYPGLYIAYARHHHGFSRFRTLLHPIFVTVEKAGNSLRFNGLDGFEQIGPGSFGNPDVLQTFSFISDPKTGATILSASSSSSVYERPDLISDPRILPKILAVLALIAISGGLIVLVPRYGIEVRARAAAATYGVIVAGAIALLFGLHAFGQPYWDGIAWPLDLVRILAWLTLPASIFMIFTAIRLRGQALAGAAKLGRLHFDVVAISSIAMVLCLIAVELISFSRIT